MDRMVNYIRLAWKLACILRIYNSMVGFSKYEFNNKLLCGIILLRVTLGVTWTQPICVCIAGRKKTKTRQQNTIQLYFNTFLTWATKHTIQQIHFSPISKMWNKTQLQPISKYKYQQITHLFLREKKLYIYIYIYILPKVAKAIMLNIKWY